MIAKSSILWAGLLSLASGVVFHTSYQVQGLEGELARIESAIVAEQEAIQVLKAEWSYLNDPARLEALVRGHTGLQPATAKQVAPVGELPRVLPVRLPAPGAAPADEAPVLAAVPRPARKPAAGDPGVVLVNLGAQPQ